MAAAQTAVMRKEGRLQISGPNINIPKKQLRAQWPAILQRLAPQDVTAHIFVDSADSYIACAAKIILTKAKVRGVHGCMSCLSPRLFAGAAVHMLCKRLPRAPAAILKGHPSAEQTSCNHASPLSPLQVASHHSAALLSCNCMCVCRRLNRCSTCLGCHSCSSLSAALL